MIINGTPTGAILLPNVVACVPKLIPPLTNFIAPWAAVSGSVAHFTIMPGFLNTLYPSSIAVPPMATYFAADWIFSLPWSARNSIGLRLNPRFS